MSDEEQIWTVVRSIFESFAARSEAGIEGRLADDCTVWDVFEPELIRGRQERDAFHARDRAQSEARGSFSWQLVPPPGNCRTAAHRSNVGELSTINEQRRRPMLC